MEKKYSELEHAEKLKLLKTDRKAYAEKYFTKEQLEDLELLENDFNEYIKRHREHRIPDKIPDKRRSPEQLKRIKDRFFESRKQGTSPSQIGQKRKELLADRKKFEYIKDAEFFEKNHDLNSRVAFCWRLLINTQNITPIEKMIILEIEFNKPLSQILLIGNKSSDMKVKREAESVICLF